MRNRDIGIMIIIIALLIGFITFSFNRALSDIVSSSCTHGETCPMWGTIRFQTNVSIAIMIFVAAIGAYLVFFSREDAIPFRKLSLGDYKDVLSTLDVDEKKVLTGIIENKGSMSQSSIVGSTKYNKVKVSRILDSLEGKKLIERRRRGMGNVIVLSH